MIYDGTTSSAIDILRLIGVKRIVSFYKSEGNSFVMVYEVNANERDSLALDPGNQVVVRVDGRVETTSKNDIFEDDPIKTGYIPVEYNQYKELLRKADEYDSFCERLIY